MKAVAVTKMPTKLVAIMPMGRPIAWPISCAFWLVA